MVLEENYLHVMNKVHSALLDNIVHANRGETIYETFLVINLVTEVILKS